MSFNTHQGCYPTRFVYIWWFGRTNWFGGRSSPPVWKFTQVPRTRWWILQPRLRNVIHLFTVSHCEWLYHRWYSRPSVSFWLKPRQQAYKTAFSPILKSCCQEYLSLKCIVELCNSFNTLLMIKCHGVWMKANRWPYCGLRGDSWVGYGRMHLNLNNVTGGFIKFVYRPETAKPDLSNTAFLNKLTVIGFFCFVTKIWLHEPLATTKK